MPFFSTVIAVHNRQDLISKTLDSVLAQEFGDQEIIVVDDGSTDDTLTRLKDYGPKITLLQQTNQGPSAARNLGLAQASGNYVAILDSDDLWFPWTLGVYHQILRERDADSFLTGAPFVFRDEKDVLEVRRNETKSEYFNDYLCSGDRWRWFGASSFVIRRDMLLEAEGFDRSLRQGEDADLALRLGIAHGFIDLQEPYTFAYREHATSLKSKAELAYRSLSCLLAKEIENQYPGGPPRAHERRRILTRHIRPFTFGVIKSPEAAKGWLLYWRTFLWHLRLGRFAYLAGFPLLALFSRRKKNP
ncbi:MAG: glycosyltransferase family 2 protein [Verrucomicrobiota bacterium]|nr:glycosyltransferase family 2 protein [Verrucomicrobiota bacterium]